MHNPLIDLPQDPFENQRNQYSKVKEETVQLQRLCFEIFHMNPDGQKLYDILKTKYLLSSQFMPTQPNASELALYWEGFKEAIRGLYDQGAAHAKRINEGGQR